MKKKFFLPFTCLFLSFVGCTSINSSPKEEKHRMEMTLQRMKTDIEDLKHDLNTFEIEHHVLEGRLSDQDHTLATLKDQTFESQESRLEQLFSEIEKLKNLISSMRESQQKFMADLKNLHENASDTHVALSQYKNKIESIEKHLALQERQFEKIAELKGVISELTLGQKGKRLKTYTVRAGDSLEKIARNHKTTVEEIKRLNHLSNDLIIVGEEISVPILSHESKK